MKILIENISIFTAKSSKRFIDRGYLYIDKGLVIAVGEGATPPDLEYADYIIDGRYSVAMPGFVVGIGDILDYVFRHKSLTRKRNEIISTLSLSDIQALSSIALASLALNGATSIVTYVNNPSHKVLSSLALAASECWIRLRIVIPVDDIDTHAVEELVKNTIRSVKDSEALSKGIVSFGFYFKRGINKDLVDLAKILNSRLYIDSILINNEVVKQILKDIVILTQSNIDESLGLVKAVALTIEQWKFGRGLASRDPVNLNPRMFIQSLSKVLEDPRLILDILCHHNPANLGLGAETIESGSAADIIILNYSKPPTGPIPISEDSVAEEISLANYIVETTMIAGELTVDQGLTLNIGEKHIRKAQFILENLDIK